MRAVIAVLVAARVYGGDIESCAEGGDAVGGRGGLALTRGAFVD